MLRRSSSRTAGRSRCASCAHAKSSASAPSRSTPKPTRARSTFASPTKRSASARRPRRRATSTSPRSSAPPRSPPPKRSTPATDFLSENAEFARICEKCGLRFIGPTPEAMRAWGDKVTARGNAHRYGLPLLPGSEVLRDVAHAIEEAKRIGFPVILKASGGGGGRGMRIVRREDEMESSFLSRATRSRNGIRNPDVYVEKFVERPQHIEFQVLADSKGRVWTLGERECSLQRRHQKIIEEAPSPVMTEELRRDIGDVIRKAVSETGYRSLGTLEFIMDEERKLYFLEMNTRVQVEHPVTEMVTGLDLVALQISVAAGEHIDLPDTRPWSVSRSRDRVPHQRGGPDVVRAVARSDHGVSPARRHRRPHRQRRLRRLESPERLRLASREAHRVGADARRSAHPHAARARRVHHRRHSNEHPAAQEAHRRSRGHLRRDDDAHDSNDSSPKSASRFLHRTISASVAFPPKALARRRGDPLLVHPVGFDV